MVKVGRKKKFDTDELVNIIQKYLDDNHHVTKLKYVDLVRYAKEILGYEKIYSQDFMRNEGVKDVVEKFNSDILNNVSASKGNFVDININSIIDNNNANMQKTILRLFKENYNQAFKKLQELSKREGILLEKLEEKERIIKKILVENKELQYEISKIKKNEAYKEKIIKEERAIRGVQYLHNRGIVSELNKNEVLDLLRGIYNLDTNDNFLEEDFLKFVDGCNSIKIVKEVLDERSNSNELPDIF